MTLEEAKRQVLFLLERDIEQQGLEVELDRDAPKGQTGKFTLDGKPARVIPPYDGFRLNINLDWFEGSEEMPKISQGPFHWYVFAIPDSSGERITDYFICDYHQMRDWVLNFDAPKGNDHRDHHNWRAKNIEVDVPPIKFVWGDEEAQDLDDSRVIKVNNVAAVLRDDLKGKQLRDPLKRAFNLFRGDRLHRLIVRIRRLQAQRIRDLLSDGSIEPDVFDREVWQIESASYVDDDDITPLRGLSDCPKLDLIESVESALDRGGLDVHGNFHWTVATHVFGAQFDAAQRKESLDRALEILNRTDLEPLTKAKRLEDVPGFGQSTATGLVMLYHPTEFAVSNEKSRTALTELGRTLSDLELFQQQVGELKEELGADDFIELDYFLYQIAENRIYVGQEPDSWPRVWWVNQGASYKEESTGGYVWAPTETKAGTTLTHHENVTKLRLGDRILHYAKGALRAVSTLVGNPVLRERPEELPSDSWQRWGYYARLDYDELETPIQLHEIPEEWRRSETGGPFTQGGAVRQGYLFRLSDEFSTKLVAQFPGLEQRFPVPPNPTPIGAEKDLGAVIDDFSSKLKEVHLRFGARHEEVVRNFVVSLATKRFVILTGLSGSGKTQIALQFGRWLGENQYRVVPVRPDWTGPESLLGYPDALQEPASDGRRAWHVPPPLEFMLEAARDPESPYLLVLDEMNLAHVERYFADVLSGIESGEACLPNLRQEEDGSWRPIPGENTLEKRPFPDNLFIAGTVNVDETTYMFSPKVLDRANTMEFRVESDDLRADIRKPGECEPGKLSLVRGFLEIATDDEWHRENPPAVRDVYVDHLKELHRSLDGGYSFGHRVLYEAVRFAALYESSGASSFEKALDVQVMQKILPRLHGSRRRLEPTLQKVGKFCYDLEAADDEEQFDPIDPPNGDPALRRSFDKVQRMTERLRANQFVSFTE